MAWPWPETTNSHWSAPRWRLLAPPSQPPGGSTIWAAWLRPLPIETRKPRPNRKLSRRIARSPGWDRPRRCLGAAPANEWRRWQPTLRPCPKTFKAQGSLKAAALKLRAPRSPWLKVCAGKKVSPPPRNSQSTGKTTHPGSGGAIGDFDDEHGAKPRVAQANDATMRGDELVRHCQAEAGAALAGRALEGLEQVGTCLLWHARSVVAHLDADTRAEALRRNLDSPLDRLAQLDCLQGIAT